MIANLLCLAQALELFVDTLQAAIFTQNSQRAGQRRTGWCLRGGDADQAEEHGWLLTGLFQ